MTAITYSGTGSSVTLDIEAKTLTFEHTGLLNSRARKKATPWVIPLAAIDSIDWREARALKGAEFRPILADRAGFNETKEQDLNYVLGSAKIGEFVAAVESVRVGGAPPAADSGAGELAPGQAAPRKGWLQSMADQAVRAEFEGLKLKGDSLTFERRSYPLAGARAQVEVGGTQRRTTATRVVVGSIVTLGVGTAIGAMAKKTTNNIYLSVDLADGRVILIEAKSKLEGDARKFAAKLNQAAAQAAALVEAQSSPAARVIVESERVDVIEAAEGPVAATPPPPPPAVPAGWYPDPNGAPAQRYWDGSAWTEHTAPLA